MKHEKNILFSAQNAEKRLSIMRNIQQKIRKMHDKFSKNANKRRKMIPQLKKKSKIYLFIKNLKIKRSNKKLNYVKIELFLIDETKKSINYKLRLSKNAKIHSIFYISILKSADPETSIQKTFYFKSNEREYEVKKFLEKL